MADDHLIDRSINIDPARSRWSPEYRTMRPNFFLNPKFEKKSNFGFGRLEPVKFSPPLSFAMNFLAIRVGSIKNYSQCEASPRRRRSIAAVD